MKDTAPTIHPVIGDALIRSADLLTDQQLAYWTRYMIALSQGDELPQRPKSITAPEARLIGGEIERMHNAQLIRREKQSQAANTTNAHRWKNGKESLSDRLPTKSDRQATQDEDEDEDKEKDEEREHPTHALAGTETDAGHGRAEGENRRKPEQRAMTADAYEAALNFIEDARTHTSLDPVTVALTAHGLPLKDKDNRNAFGAALKEVGRETFLDELKAVVNEWATTGEEYPRPSVFQRRLSGSPRAEDEF